MYWIAETPVEIPEPTASRSCVSVNPAFVSTVRSAKTPREPVSYTHLTLPTTPYV